MTFISSVNWVWAKRRPELILLHFQHNRQLQKTYIRVITVYSVQWKKL